MRPFFRDLALLIASIVLTFGSIAVGIWLHNHRP